MNKLDEYISKYKGIYDGTQKLTLRNGIHEPKINKGEEYGDGIMFVKKVTSFIKYMIDRKNRAVSVLDYGCGRAIHTHNRSYPYALIKDRTIFELFSGLIQCYYCYDPGVQRYSTKPTPGTMFDFVAMADVLEHVPEECVKEVLTDAASFVKPDGFLMATVSGVPAFAYFLNDDRSLGENLHCTTKPLDWWINMFHEVLPDKSFLIMYERPCSTPNPDTDVETIIYNHNSKHFSIDRKDFPNFKWLINNTSTEV